MIRPLALAVLAAIATALPAVADDADTGPAKLSPLQIGQIFCIARVGNDMAPVEAILTASLQKAIARADALNAAWAKKNPGEKPPLGDGRPWQGHPDYTTDCTAAKPVATAKAASVEVSYAFSDAPDAGYTDTLRLKPVFDKDIGADVWRLDDIAFDDQTTMRQQMVDAFKP